MRDALPNASFIGFTGTPIEKTDANTRAVFGDYVSIYDIQRAVIDGATVPIVEHFENRLVTMAGKAMVVCMSRRICVDLYREIAALRPDWRHEDDNKGLMKVVMTGSASDPLGWQQHILNKPRREDLALRFRDAAGPFKIVIVRDMWLTGFDAPSLHTMYLDKPMRGHGLMQAIARVNRVFRDKPGGLVVDYLGLADELRKALASYTESGGTGKTAIDQSEAVALRLEKYEICCGLFHGFNWSRWTRGLMRIWEVIENKGINLVALTGIEPVFQP